MESQLKPLVRANVYQGAQHRFVDRDAAIVEALKDGFEALIEAHHLARKALEYDHTQLTDLEGLLRDAWSDTWALVASDVAEATGREVA